MFDEVFEVVCVYLVVDVNDVLFRGVVFWIFVGDGGVVEIEGFVVVDFGVFCD